MEYIELVIKIPNGAYNLLKTGGVDWLGAEHILNAVANGTPLPKGHGRLIDENYLMPDSDYEDGTFYAVSIGQIKRASTIIEADKESEVEE